MDTFDLESKSNKSSVSLTIYNKNINKKIYLLYKANHREATSTKYSIV